MSSIVKVENLVKYYGTDGNIVKAVDHTDLEIERENLRQLSAVPVPESPHCFISWGGLMCRIRERYL